MKLSWLSDFSRLTQQFMIVLAILSSAACDKQQQIAAPSDFGAGAIVGVNYTDNGIQWFTVDGAAGASLGTYSGGGGFVCCASYPKTWRPSLNVAVRWERSDGRESGGTRWKTKAFESTVSVEKYVEEGNVYVLFLPNDQVKVFISVVGIGNPSFPTNPGYPEDAVRNDKQ